MVVIVVNGSYGGSYGGRCKGGGKQLMVVWLVWVSGAVRMVGW